MRYRYEEVTKTPKPLEAGIVYHNPSFELATLLCACGCGHKVTLLVPDGHRVINNSGYATITPSIGVFDAPCMSHYFITNGHVRMLMPFRGAQAASVMRSQIARHARRDEKPVEEARGFWAGLKKLWKRFFR
ncbi:DUF6527 family protein [Peiella sedimenti]|uniref:DUF6527 family protein n=1 Tax=Peiella sedimenti TaxID=3061083 RepID=UPI003CC7054A